jgi:hypothetical protein
LIFAASTAPLPPATAVGTLLAFAPATVFVLAVLVGGEIGSFGWVSARRSPRQVEFFGRLVFLDLTGVHEGCDQLGLLKPVGLDSGRRSDLPQLVD